MPRISLCFQGHVNGANIDTAIDSKTNQEVDVSGMSSEELIQKLDNGELAVSLTDAMNDCDNSGAELFDYDTYPSSL